MSTYELMVRIIDTGKKTKENMLQMCDVFYAAGRLTADEYTDLISKINK